jgi:hypothetical protein
VKYPIFCLTMWYMYSNIAIFTVKHGSVSYVCHHKWWYINQLFSGLKTSWSWVFTLAVNSIVEHEILGHFRQQKFGIWSGRTAGLSTHHAMAVKSTRKVAHRRMLPQTHNNHFINKLREVCFDMYAYTCIIMYMVYPCLSWCSRFNGNFEVL